MSQTTLVDVAESITTLGTMIAERIENVKTSLTSRIDGLEATLGGRIDGLTGRMDGLEARMFSQEKLQRETNRRLSRVEGTLEAVENDIKELYGYSPN
jgi:hypothetical protein